MTQDGNTADGGFAAARRLLEAVRAAVQISGHLLDEAEGKSGGDQEAGIGQAFYQLGDYRSAREHLTAAFALAPRADTAIRLALTEWRAGELDTAEAWAERAIELDPTGRFEALIAQTNPSYCSVLSEIQLRRGNVAAAELSATAALNIDSRDVAALTVLSTTRLAVGDGESAARFAQQAFEAAPVFLRDELQNKHMAITAFTNNNSPMVLNFAEVMVHAL